MLIETTEYNIKIPILLLTWYFIEMPKVIISYLNQYLKSISYVFSLRYLLQTLFSPWKNQIEQYPSKGFDLKKIIEVFSANMISRLVGLIIRFVVLTVGLLIEIIVIILGFLSLTVWLFGPFILVLLPVIIFYLP